MAMPLLEIAWFETVVAAQRDKNLPPEADERRVVRGHVEETSPARQPHQAASGPAKLPPR
jgi:hypothetical protein